MKYLKSFNESTNQEIDIICKKYGIENYIINEDGTIDVDGDVNLSNKGLSKIPLKFNYVSGDFSILRNKLITLEGAPQKVDGYFDCKYNNLITLKYAPKNVGDGFSCSNNELTNLIDAPINLGYGFDCGYNKITTLKGIPKIINGNLICTKNEIKNIDYLPICKNLIIYNNPIFGIIELFDIDIACTIYNTRENKDILYDFIDKEIIQEDILLIDRLVEFLEDIGKPYSKEELYELLKKDYTIR